MQHNLFQVSGYLAAKPDLRFLPSGTKVANCRLGESFRLKGKDQKAELHTNWHNLTFYNELADRALSFEQGDHLFVEGRLQQRQFTPADGSKRTVTEIVVNSCHLIAARRNNQIDAAGGGEPTEEEVPGDNSQAGAFDTNWPL